MIIKVGFRLHKAACRTLIQFDHSEVEMLLESFSKQVEEIVNEVDTLVVRNSV